MLRSDCPEASDHASADGFKLVLGTPVEPAELVLRSLLLLEH